MRATVNILCVLLLTFLLTRLDSWSDTASAAVNAFSQTAMWVWFRSSLGVHGPENEETLMIGLIISVAFFVSIGVVWGLNKAVGSSPTFRRSQTGRAIN